MDGDTGCEVQNAAIPIEFKRGISRLSVELDLISGRLNALQTSISIAVVNPVVLMKSRRPKVAHPFPPYPAEEPLSLLGILMIQSRPRKTC